MNLPERGGHMDDGHFVLRDDGLGAHAGEFLGERHPVDVQFPRRPLLLEKVDGAARERHRQGGEGGREEAELRAELHRASGGLVGASGGTPARTRSSAFLARAWSGARRRASSHFDCASADCPVV